MVDHVDDVGGEETAVDFESDDIATSCPHCPDWHREVAFDRGVEVSREWHAPGCPVVVNWL
ncbi:hypothetical protein [Solicola sp. PLA-1-18]|uniref:hypothetical protein n=1 Tax=Solicola sp. PLA-1-18 TaxID=3380532 RepID=UPI003B7F0E65